MYSTILAIHSWIRWIALIAAVGATFAAVRGKVQGPDSLADRWGLFAMMTLDIQMLLGLLLYLVVSPNMQEIRENFGEAMKNPQLRFWAVEHISAMFAALVLVHVGRVLARKARDTGRQAHAPARVLRARDRPDDARDAVAGNARRHGRCSAYDRATLLRMWASELGGARAGSAVAFVAAIIEVSVPHFGSVFVSVGAIAAAAVAFFGFGVPAQVATFVVVLVVSLVGLRSRLIGRLGGQGVPSRTEPLIGRHGMVTHDIDPTRRHRPRQCRRRGLGGAQPGTDRAGHQGPRRRRRRHRAGGDTRMNSIVLFGLGVVPPRSC